MVCSLDYGVTAVWGWASCSWKYLFVLPRSQWSKTRCEHHGPEVRNLRINSRMSRPLRAHQALRTCLPLRIHEVRREDSQMRMPSLPQVENFQGETFFKCRTITNESSSSESSRLPIPPKDSVRLLNSWDQLPSAARRRLILKRKIRLEISVDRTYPLKFNSGTTSCMSEIKSMIPERSSKFCPAFPRKTPKFLVSLSPDQSIWWLKHWQSPRLKSGQVSKWIPKKELKMISHQPTSELFLWTTNWSRTKFKVQKKHKRLRSWKGSLPQLWSNSKE